MKFVSKIQNLSIVLRNGLPAEPLSGRPAVAGLYVRFKEGAADVQDAEMIRLMSVHPSFNKDFVSVEEGALDPFQLGRKSMEPKHELMEMQFGHVGQSHNMKQPPRDINKVIMEIATDMAKKMAPEMAKEILKTMSQQTKGMQVPDAASQVEPLSEDEGGTLSPDGPEEALEATEYKKQMPEAQEKKRMGRPPTKTQIAKSGPAAVETL